MNFYIKFITELLIDSANYFSEEENFDQERFGKIEKIPVTLKGHIKQTLEKVFNHFGYDIVQRQDLRRFMGEKVAVLDPYLKDLEHLYNMLSDEKSKALLIKLLCYRVLGFRKVKLPVNTPEFWHGIKEMEEIAD